jgi:hypothetical protein
MKRINQIFDRLAGSALKAAPVAILLGGVFASPQMAWAQPPTSVFTHIASKDNNPYTSTIVGTNPFNSTAWGNGPQITAVVVPVAITINGTTFDPTVPDPTLTNTPACQDTNIPAQTRFYYSPLNQNVPSLTFEGVNVGNTQYINGFRRAEFWRVIGGSTAYQNPITFQFPYANANLAPFSTTSSAPFNIGISVGAGETTQLTNSNGCTGTLGAVAGLDTALESLIPTLVNNFHVIKSDGSELVIFLLRNVVQVQGGFVLGSHGALGNQTYAVIDWDTLNAFGQADGSIASHEIAEWMDDPMYNNVTPGWGNLGEVSGCPTTPSPSNTASFRWEAGDPVTGHLMPPIQLPKSEDPYQFPYHMQELAFFSLFFNSGGAPGQGPADPSVGASYYIYKQGTFSSNGTYLAPANACPSGGVGPFGGKNTYTNPITGLPISLITTNIL